LVVLGACARAAPELPPAYGEKGAPELPKLESMGAADASMSCDAIELERESVRSEMKELEATIVSTHDQNQAIGYAASAFFPPLVLAADHHLKATEQLDEKQQRLDRLILLDRLKACRATRR
jgi:hypothetical protein